MVLKVELCDDRTKRIVSGRPGDVSVKDKKSTVRGNIDPVSVGPIKEPEKKKEDPKRTAKKPERPIKEPEKKKEDPKRTAKKPEKKEEEKPEKKKEKNQVAVAKPLKGPHPSPGFLVQSRREEYLHIRMQEKKGETKLTIVQGVKKDFNYKKIP